MDTEVTQRQVRQVPEWFIPAITKDDINNKFTMKDVRVTQVRPMLAYTYKDSLTGQEGVVLAPHMTPSIQSNYEERQRFCASAALIISEAAAAVRA